MGSGVFYDGQLIPISNWATFYGKKVIEKYAVDSIRKQENLEFDEWGERLRYYRCRRKCC